MTPDAQVKLSAALDEAALKAAQKLIENVWPGFGDRFYREAQAYMEYPDVFAPCFATARDGAGVVGLAVLTEAVTSTKLLAISWLCVDAAHRQRGIGGALVAACLKEAARQEKAVILSTKGPDFYAGKGFCTTGRYGLDHYLMVAEPLAAEKT